MATSPDDWSRIPIESLSRNELTPAAAGIGVHLRAPSRVEPDTPLPVTGAITLQGAERILPAPWSRRLVFVASSANGWVASGQKFDDFQPMDDDVPAPPFNPSPTRRETEYFTTDLRTVFRVPLPEGRLFIYAFVGRHVSNVVTVDVAPAPEPEED